MHLRNHIELLELTKPIVEKDVEDLNLSEYQIGESSDAHQQISENKLEDYLHIIQQSITWRYIINIKIIIHEEFTPETHVLVDTGAYRNCIREGLIHTKYYEKMTQRLSTANDQKLKIKYKLPNAVICIDEFCLYLTFILVRCCKTLLICCIYLLIILFIPN